MTPVIVAIDGPAGSGKSSVSKEVARRLGYAYLDTGAAYRALAWHARHTGADLDSAESVTASLAAFDYAVSTDPDDFWVRVDGIDVTEAIRDPAVSAIVSKVARVSAVREHLNALFRSIAAATDRPGIVIEGRDITTVTVPDAPVRILLTASEGVRAARRAGELSGAAAARAGEAIARRDAADSQVADFLTAAAGVVTVDSTALDFVHTVDAVLAVIRSVVA